MFKVLVVMYAIFMLIAFVVKKGAIAAECILVFQLTYLMILGQSPLLQAKSGLQQTGKYTFGYNLAILTKYYRDDLMTLDLDSNAVNSLSITFFLILLLFLTTLILMTINHFIKKKEN